MKDEDHQKGLQLAHSFSGGSSESRTTYRPEGGKAGTIVSQGESPSPVVGKVEKIGG